MSSNVLPATTSLPRAPVTFGNWLIDGDCLTCRLPRSDIVIRAPKRLLSEVMRLCDGVSSWGEVMNQLELAWDATEIGAFMRDLVREGVLVEGGLQLAHWSALAFSSAPVSSIGKPDEISRLHLVAQNRLFPGRGGGGSQLGQSPFAKLLEKRKSTRTFGDLALHRESLCSILWSAYGVVRGSEEGESTRWHRTVSSGGALYSARWFLAVLRDLPGRDGDQESLSAGLYEGCFHHQGGASLRKLPGEAHEAWRWLLDPRCLRFASAMIVPVFDISGPAVKYGNRATWLAMIEAGQALQNAQLMTTELGDASTLMGGVRVDKFLHGIGLRNEEAHWLPGPALVIGTSPSNVQEYRLKEFGDLVKVAPALLPAADGFAFGAVPSADAYAGYAGGGGFSVDPSVAVTKAEAECWERQAWLTPSDLSIGCIVDIDGAIDPREIVAYSDRQYKKRGFPFHPFSGSRRYLWKSAVDAVSGRSYSVLSECVYASSALPERFQKYAYTSSSTSGMAAGVSTEDALCRATLELVERDAFCCAWISGRALKAVNARSLPRTVWMRIKTLQALGFEVTVLDVSTRLAPVVAIFAQSEQMPMTAIAAAADFEAERALERALSEIERRVAYVQHHPVAPVQEANPMRVIERYYRSRRTFRKADFLVANAESISFGVVGRGSCGDWVRLMAEMASHDQKLLMIDLTPSGATIEQGRVPLHVVRAVVPGLVPIWFHAGLQPAGLPRFISAAGTAERVHAVSSYIHPFT